MANTQSKSHRADHIKNRMTASQYCSDSNFKALAKQFKQIREADNLEEIKILFSKPLKSNQTKGNQEETKSHIIKESQIQIIIPHEEKKLSNILQEPKLIKKITETPNEETKNSQIVSQLNSKLKQNKEQTTTDDADDELEDPEYLNDFLFTNQSRIRNPGLLIVDNATITKELETKKSLSEGQNQGYFELLLDRMERITQNQDSIKKDLHELKKNKEVNNYLICNTFIELGISN